MKPKREKITLDDLNEEAAPSALGETSDHDVAAARFRRQQSDAAEAIKRHKKLTDRVAHEQQIVDSFGEVLQANFGHRFSINIPPAPRAKLTKPKRTPEEAVLVISDSHIGKIVKPSQTLGFGNYNTKIFLDRLYFLEKTVTRLIQHNVHNPVERINVLLLGDLVEGMLGHGSEIPMRELIAPQVLIASLAFYQFIARLSRVAPVTVRGLGGNHSRFPGIQAKKCPTENRFSNFDYIALGQIEQLIQVSGIDRVKMILEENPFQVFDIQGWRFKIGHGDHLKGGDKAMGVPAHSIGREINATTQRYAARGQRPPDYYLVGDKHRHMSLQTATGRWMCNGAFFSDCGYSMTENFTPGKPFQTFFGMHPEIGKSWSYELTLDRAPSVPLQYDFPSHLRNRILAHE